MTTKKPSMKQAILSKCHDCMGHYADGKANADCRNQACSLYFWMPYASLTPDRTWELFSPKKIGLQLKTAAVRTMTDEQRKACAERLSAARQKKTEEVEASLTEDDDSEDVEEEEDDE
jgi:hypothetical protein